MAFSASVLVNSQQYRDLHYDWWRNCTTDYSLRKHLGHYNYLSGPLSISRCKLEYCTDLLAQIKCLYLLQVLMQEKCLLCSLCSDFPKVSLFPSDLSLFAVWLQKLIVSKM